MMSAIVRHEWKSLRADRTLAVVTALFALAIGYGLFNGYRWVNFQRATIAEAAAEETTRLADLQARAATIERTGAKVSPFADPRNAAAVGQRLGLRYAAMPPAPLAALSIGQSDLLPYYVKMSTESKDLVASTTELENPHRLLTGRFDLSFVIVYLYPLLILALTYNMLSAEKEQGMLALLLSQPVSLRTLMAGKVGVRVGLFAALVIGFAVIGLLVAGVELDASTALVRLALWAGAVTAYGLFWFALALFVTALGRPSATNAMMVAGAWLVLVVLLPSLFNLLAMTLYPVPSRVELVQAVREASDAATAEGSRLLGKYYEDHPELAADSSERAMSDFNVVRVAVQSKVETDVRPVLDAFHRQLASQQAMIDRLRPLSPAIVMQDALSDVAGTGVARHRHFLSLVDTYHAEWRAFFVPRIFAQAKVLDHESIPRFTFHDEPFDALVRRALTALAWLLAPTLVLAWFGLARLQRYPIVG